MPLPHFNHVSSALYAVEPIYLSLFEVRFSDTFLMDNCNSIENDTMIFNLYDIKDELQPFEIINNMIKNNKILNYLEIVNHKKDGTIKYCVFLKNFSFIEFIGFLDFDWASYDKSGDKLKNLKVKFKYDKMNVITGNNYNNFVRKIKLECINKKDS